jgi:hypothetical protein
LHNPRYMGEIPNIPSDIPEEGTYNYYLHIVDNQLMPQFTRDLERLNEKPTLERIEAISNTRDLLAENYTLAVAHLIVVNDWEQAPVEKELAVQTLRETESLKRVEIINSIVKFNLLEPREYPKAEEDMEEVIEIVGEQKVVVDETDSPIGTRTDVDSRDWAEFEVEKFIEELDQDLDTLFVYLNENHPYVKRQILKNAALERGKQVATIVGSVALGVLFSRTLDRRKPQ